MKNGVIFYCFIFLFSFNVYSQNNEVYMLKPGIVKAISYNINTRSNPEGMDQINYIQFMKISEREKLFYEIQIYYNHNNMSEYWYFKIKNIENTGEIINGKLFEISCEDTGGMWYIDDKAYGTINIDLINNIVTVEILFHNYNSESNHKIVWENIVDN